MNHGKRELFLPVICCLWIVLVFVSIGCQDTQQEVITLAIEGAPETVEAVKDWLRNNPQVAESILGKRFTIKIISPEKEIEYKIDLIKPDPTMDFKIGIIDPAEIGALPEMREKIRQLAEAIRNKMQRSDPRTQ